MTPFDEPKFQEALRKHFRRCGGELQADDAGFYFAELKSYPLSAIVKALEAHETADARITKPATVADLKRHVKRLRGAGELAEPREDQQCAHVDHGYRCEKRWTSRLDGQPGFCAEHFGR